MQDIRILLVACFSLVSFLDMPFIPEDGSYMFFRNVGFLAELHGIVSQKTRVIYFKSVCDIT
jgi:hypothetical protein